MGGFSVAPEPVADMPRTGRKPNDVARQMAPLALLGVGLVLSNPRVTMIDDEAWVLDGAARSVRELLATYLSGNGLHPHPPLYDILLHFWLRGTRGEFDYLRVPSILFFLAGLFLLGFVAHQFGRVATAVATTWLGVLWPFGFHFGRLATWYPFSFFLVAGLTLAYWKYLEERSLRRWVALLLFGACLIWTTYFGWAILACLGVDQAIRTRSKEPAASPKVLLGTTAVLCLSFFPLARAFGQVVSNRVYLNHRAATILANAAFNVFSLFVSESIAPWFWWLSIPAGLAIAVSLLVVGRWSPWPARRFLLYAAALIVLMALIGILDTKRLLTISPWVLFPAGVAIDAAKPRWATFSLAGALLVIGVAGWYGVYARRFYSAPRFIEPWQEVASDAAERIRNGATVVADHPSFLLYLTYALRPPAQSGEWSFRGLVAYTVPYPRVYSPAEWLAAGKPRSARMVLVRGAGDPGGDSPIDEAARQMDQSCGSIMSRLRLRDSGYAWKQRFFPELGEPQWRIEVREYDCDSSNSKEIYKIPPAEMH